MNKSARTHKVSLCPIPESTHVPAVSRYDIVYYCGESAEWEPADSKLGGAQQAVVQLCRQWARQGRSVGVYMALNGCHAGLLSFDGINFHHFSEFDPTMQYQNLIVWRLYGTLALLNHDIRAVRLLIDMHDNLPAHYDAIHQHLERTLLNNTVLMFKSHYHKREYEAVVNSNLSPDQYRIISNGINMEAFSIVHADTVESRNPFRLCYCSDYRRGLLSILALLWPIIKIMEPRAELHLYYGLPKETDGENQAFKDEFHRVLAKTTGVCDHGRQSIQLVGREKRMSNFHLYITDSIAEIDCISIRESLVAGCIPLLMKTGVFLERDGVHFGTKETVFSIASRIVGLMHDQAQCNDLRSGLRRSPTITTWEQAADDWALLF